MSWEVLVSHGKDVGLYVIGGDVSEQFAKRMAQAAFARELGLCWFQVQVDGIESIDKPP